MTRNEKVHCLRRPLQVILPSPDALLLTHYFFIPWDEELLQQTDYNKQKSLYML